MTKRSKGQNTPVSSASRRRIGLRWSIPLVGFTTGAFLVGGAALAASTPWNVPSSSGTGASSAKTSAALTVAAGTAAGTLYPGGNGDVVVTLQNTNPFTVQVTQLALGTATTVWSNSALTTTSTASTACATNGSGVSWSTTGTKTLATPVNIAANSTYTLTLTANATMATTSDNNCQGMFFALPITGYTAALTTAAPSVSPGQQA